MGEHHTAWLLPVKHAWQATHVSPAASPDVAPIRPAVSHAGIGVRESFNQNATSTLLATGILDALSTGVLLYVVLVQLITPTLTDSDWLHSRRWPMQLLAYAAFYSGAACMAVIGKWA